MSKLKDVMRNITEFDKASKFLDVNVVSEFYSRSIIPTNVVRSWPGKHKKFTFGYCWRMDMLWVGMKLHLDGLFQ